MNTSFHHYFTGQEVHAGDRVRYKGGAGNVAFVSDGEGGQFASGFADYYGYEAGIMLSNDEGELTFISEPNEDLEFISRTSLLSRDFDSAPVQFPSIEAHPCQPPQ